MNTNSLHTILNDLGPILRKWAKVSESDRKWAKAFWNIEIMICQNFLSDGWIINLKVASWSDRNLYLLYLISCIFLLSYIMYKLTSYIFLRHILACDICKKVTLLKKPLDDWNCSALPHRVRFDTNLSKWQTRFGNFQHH